MKLIVFGDLNLDVCVGVDNFPSPGQDAAASSAALLPGGSAANCAAVSAHLGATVEFVGVTGQDALAQLLIDDLHTFGVGTRWLQQSASPTGLCVAINDADGERTFLSYRGANSTTLEAIASADLFGPQDCLHVSGYSFQDQTSRQSALALIAQARTAKARISLDPSFQFARDYADLLTVDGLTDFIFPNWIEAQLMTHSDSPQTAAAILRQRGIATVVVKLGHEGCYVDSPEIQQFIPAYPVSRVVDTVGAGDAFCAGFLTAMQWGLPHDHAARLGHAAAAHVIGAMGGHQAAPTLDETITMIRAYGALDLAVRLKAIHRAW